MGSWPSLFFSFFFFLKPWTALASHPAVWAAPVSMRTGLYEVDWVIGTCGQRKSTPIKRHANDQIREAFILQWRVTTVPICCAGLHTTHCYIWWCRAKIGRQTGGHNKKANQQEVQTSLTSSHQSPSFYAPSFLNDWFTLCALTPSM